MYVSVGENYKNEEGIGFMFITSLCFDFSASKQGYFNDMTKVCHPNWSMYINFKSDLLEEIPKFKCNSIWLKTFKLHSQL